MYDRDADTGEQGVIYTLCFSEPYGHAQHYTGWTHDLESRLEAHRKGQGARLTQVLKQVGISFTLARTEAGTRNRERQLKQQGGASRRCPLCKGQEPQLDHQEEPQHAVPGPTE